MQRVDRKSRPHTISFRVTEAEWKKLEARVPATKAKSPHAVAEMLVVDALSERDPTPSTSLTAKDLSDLRRSLRKSFSTLLTNLRKDVSVDDARKLFQPFFAEGS